MTVLREISGKDPRLFPLRYARRTPRHPRPQDLEAARRAGVAAPQVPLLLIPDGPGRASVLPYDRLRRNAMHARQSVEDFCEALRASKTNEDEEASPTEERRRWA